MDLAEVMVTFGIFIGARFSQGCWAAAGTTINSIMSEKMPVQSFVGMPPY
jgi:hypothetical protein